MVSNRNLLAPLGVEPARGPWTNLGRLPLRVFSIGKYAFQKKANGAIAPGPEVELQMASSS